MSNCTKVDLFLSLIFLNQSIVSMEFFHKLYLWLLISLDVIFCNTSLDIKPSLVFVGSFGSRLLLKQILLKTVEHCLLFLILFFQDPFVIFLMSGERWWRNNPISSAQTISTILLVVVRGSVVLSKLLNFYCLKICIILFLSCRSVRFQCFVLNRWKCKVKELINMKTSKRIE